MALLILTCQIDIGIVKALCYSIVATDLPVRINCTTLGLDLRGSGPPWVASPRPKSRFVQTCRNARRSTTAPDALSPPRAFETETHKHNCKSIRMLVS